MLQKLCFACSEPGPQETLQPPLSVLQSCLHLENEPRLACWRMSGHVEDSQVLPREATWDHLPANCMHGREASLSEQSHLPEPQPAADALENSAQARP